MNKVHRITETQLTNIVKKFLNEATPEGNTNSRMASLERGFTEKIGSSLFKNGIDSIDTSNLQFLKVVNKIKNLSPDFKITIQGGASAVGSSSGYDNKSLAKRRTNNFINALKKFNVDTSRIQILPPIVGSSTVKNSPEAESEQFVKISAVKPNKIESAIDNTAVEKPLDTIRPIQNINDQYTCIKVPKKKYKEILDLLIKNGFKIR